MATTNNENSGTVLGFKNKESGELIATLDVEKFQDSEYNTTVNRDIEKVDSQESDEGESSGDPRWGEILSWLEESEWDVKKEPGESLRLSADDVNAHITLTMNPVSDLSDIFKNTEIWRDEGVALESQESVKEKAIAEARIEAKGREGKQDCRETVQEAFSKVKQSLAKDSSRQLNSRTTEQGPSMTGIPSNWRSLVLSAVAIVITIAAIYKYVTVTTPTIGFLASLVILAVTIIGLIVLQWQDKTGAY
jgi:hypothetical protein